MCIFYIRLPNSTNCVKFFPNQFQQMKLVNNLFQQRLSMDLSSSMACIHLPLGSCDTFCTSIVHYKLTQNHQCGNHLNYNSRKKLFVSVTFVNYVIAFEPGGVFLAVPFTGYYFLIGV